VLAQRLDGGGRQHHLAARRACLRLADRHALRPPLERRAHGKRLPLEIDVLPPEPQELALAHPRRQRQHVERFEVVALRGRQECPRLLGRKRPEGMPAHARRVDERGDVADHVPPAHRMVEGAMEHGVDVMDRRRREAALEKRAVKTLHVARVELG